MTYSVTYYKVPVMVGGGRWVTRDIEAGTWLEAREKATKSWGFRNIKSIAWVR